MKPADFGLCFAAVSVFFLLSPVVEALSSPFNDSSNFFNRSFCSLVKFTGVSTTILQYRLPLKVELYDLTPLPYIRIITPVWVSGCTVIFTGPSNVGTSTLPPSAAVVKLIGTSQYKSLPSRVKIS